MFKYTNYKRRLRNFAPVKFQAVFAISLHALSDELERIDFPLSGRRPDVKALLSSHALYSS
jgi:hypothetical protein